MSQYVACKLKVSRRGGFRAVISAVYGMPKKHTTSNKTRKRKGKDMDEITEQLGTKNHRCFTTQQVNFNPDLPGNGLFYCIECDRYFIDDKSLSCHKSSKVHRQRLKRLREPVYSQREAEESVGLKTTVFA